MVEEIEGWALQNGKSPARDRGSLRVADLTDDEAEALLAAVPEVKDLLAAIEISRRRTAGREIIQRMTGVSDWKARKYARVIRIVVRRKDGETGNR